jgi:hypothetical protein
MFMQPMIIDVAGTIEQFMKWIAVQVLVILGVIAFGLSAPVLFSVGALWLAWRAADCAPFWALIYLIAGPFACAFWMILLSALPKFVAICKGIRLTHDRESNIPGSGTAMRFMFIGFFGSILAEGVFTYAAHRMSVIPGHLMLFFAVFAPCWLVVLSRWIRRDEYATA